MKICISMPVDIADALAEDFTKASGVETQVVPLPPGSAENRFNFLASARITGCGRLCTLTISAF